MTFEEVIREMEAYILKRLTLEREEATEKAAFKIAEDIAAGRLAGEDEHELADEIRRCWGREK